jgi:hypothetical protein
MYTDDAMQGSSMRMEGKGAVNGDNNHKSEVTITVLVRFTR